MMAWCAQPLGRRDVRRVQERLRLLEGEPLAGPEADPLRAPPAADAGDQSSASARTLQRLGIARLGVVRTPMSYRKLGYPQCSKPNEHGAES